MGSHLCSVVKTLKSLSVSMQKCGKSSNSQKSWKWDVTELTTTEVQKIFHYGVIVLNRPISQNPEFLCPFWNNAQLRIAVDGGAVQWDKFIGNLPVALLRSMKLPELVTGDFDSINDNVMQKYKELGCKIIHTPDQDHTDFTKALIELNSHCCEQNIKGSVVKLDDWFGREVVVSPLVQMVPGDPRAVQALYDEHKYGFWVLDHVIAIAQSSGRIDQTLGNIQTLFLAKEKKLVNPNTKVYLMSDDFISWLLSPGEHVINIPEEIRNHKRVWCSLVPIGETCQSVTTTGLKWNLDKASLRFGDIVSTSNTYSGADKVHVKCSHTLLWSMKIPRLINCDSSILKSAQR